MSILTVLLFFVYIYGLGFSLTYFLKNSTNFLERNLMRLGIGMGVFPILSVIFNLLHIPLDWRFFLIVSLAVPLYVLGRAFIRKEFPRLGFKLTKSNLYILIVLLLFFGTLFMYTKGAFVYPYFEDDDPWVHALGVKYVAIEKNVREPDFFAHRTMYIDPYPPSYDILMGVLHQTSISLMWTLKFFNALIISLGIIFFYFFAKEFIGDKKRALFSTFVLVMIPCYMSHFIWAHSLVVTLFFPAMYCLERIKYDRKWLFAGLIIIASMAVTQPTQPVKLGVMFLTYFIVKSIYEKRFLKESLAAIIGGYLLSFVWWATKWRAMFGRETRGVGEVTIGSSSFSLLSFLKKVFPPNSGTATRAYTFDDFFVAKTQNMINNPVGIGVVISILVLISLIYVIIKFRHLLKKENSWIMITLIWLLFTFIGLNSMTFNTPGFYSFRFWMLFAIAVSIISSAGAWFLFGLSKKIGLGEAFVLVILVVGIVFTSGYQKYAVNTAMWGPGQGWTSMEEVQGYVWLKNLEPNTKVFTFVGDEPIIGFDKYSCAWCKDVYDFKEDALNKSISEVYDWLRIKQYEYIIISGRTYLELEGKYGKNETDRLVNEKLSEISTSNLFQVVYNNKGAVIFKVV